MECLSKALNELYKGIDSPEDTTESIESAIELLQDGLGSISVPMAAMEIVDVIQSLIDSGDIESAIYELEVINNEL